jgi:hypothetical protein
MERPGVLYHCDKCMLQSTNHNLASTAIDLLSRIRRLNFSAPHIRWYYPPMLLKDSPLLEQPSRGRQRGCWGGSASARQNHHLGLQGGVHHSALKKQNETRPHK